MNNPINLITEKEDIPYLLATDMIIEQNVKSRDGIYIIERKFTPFGLALPGGIVEPNLTLEENAIKESKEETGLDIIIKNAGWPFTFSKLKRDPRRRVITTVYIAEGYGVAKAGDDAKAVHHVSFSDLEKLLGQNKFVMDHEEIIQNYLNTWRFLPWEQLYELKK
jgi:8-oxo-dGTP diphosphatase